MQACLFFRRCKKFMVGIWGFVLKKLLCECLISLIQEANRGYNFILVAIHQDLILLPMIKPNYLQIRKQITTDQFTISIKVDSLFWAWYPLTLPLKLVCMLMTPNLSCKVLNYGELNGLVNKSAGWFLVWI